MGSVKIKLHKRSTHWKDQMAGWHEYEATYPCSNCGKQVTERVYGVFEEVRDSFTAPEKRRCEACAAKLEQFDI